MPGSVAHAGSLACFSGRIQGGIVAPGRAGMAVRARNLLLRCRNGEKWHGHRRLRRLSWTGARPAWMPVRRDCGWMLDLTCGPDAAWRAELTPQTAETP